MLRRSSSGMTIERRSAPMMILSLAFSKSSMSTVRPLRPRAGLNDRLDRVTVPPPRVRAPKVAAAVPKPVPAMKPAQLPAQPSAPIGPATAAPRALASSAPPAAKPAPAAAPVASAPAASGSTVLQIGAYKSRADADTAWNIYKTKHASLLSGYSPDVQQADLGEKGTWYRLRIAGFPDRCL